MNARTDPNTRPNTTLLSLAMIITAVEDLHANADYRDFSFCKISTDDPSVVGW